MPRQRENSDVVHTFQKNVDVINNHETCQRHENDTKNYDSTEKLNYIIGNKMFAIIIIYVL